MLSLQFSQARLHKKGLMRGCIMCGEWERSSDWFAPVTELHVLVPAFLYCGVLKQTVQHCQEILHSLSLSDN